MAIAAKPRIAIVDDDALSLAVMSDALDSASYVVTLYRTGEEALAALWDTGTDLLVTDILLPRMSGLDLVREVRCRPWADKVGIIAVSALQWDREQLGSLHKALQPGCVLTKPFPPGELVVAVTALLASLPVAEPPPSIRWPSRSLPLVRPSTSELQAVGKERVRVQVSLETARELVAEYTQSLMHDGLFVPSYHPLALDTEVEVQLTLPFRGALKVSGKVVQAIDLDSAESLTRGPGMAIALYDLPKDVKREIKAFVAGVRAGSVGTPPRSDRVVVLAGLRALLPTDVSSFLHRSGVHGVHAADLAGAMDLTKRIQPRLVALDGHLLGDEARAWLAAFHSLGIRSVMVVANEPLASRLPSDLPFVSIVPPGPEIPDTIATRLDLAQRAAARVPLATVLQASRPDGAVLAHLENVSLGGVLLVTETPCAVGERLQLAFELPGGQGSVRAVARTLRVMRRATSSEVQVAAAFERLDPDSIDTLRRYLEGQVGARAYRYLGNTFS
jgi:DNA-binding response OmpR family regulator